MAISGERPLPYPGVPPKKEEQVPSKISRRRFLKLLGGTGVVALGVGAYQVPAVRREVDRQIDNATAIPTAGFDVLTQSPDVFDPKWKGARLTSKNTVAVSPDQQHATQYDLSSKTMALPVPFEIKGNMGVIVKKDNKNAPALVFNNIPDGTIVYAPIDGRFRMETYPKEASGSLAFLDEKGRMRLLLFQMGDAKAISSTYETKTKIIDGKVAPESSSWNPKVGVSVKAGTPLFTINSGRTTLYEGEQLSINLSYAAANPDGTPLFEKGQPVVQSVDLSVKATNNKAEFIKPQ